MSFLLLGASGCGEVDHCPKGSLRCLGGRCDNRACDFDLLCAVRPTGEELCGKKLKGGRFDFGDQGKGEGTEVTPIDPDCSCPAPQVCAADTGECVNYCEAADPLPHSGKAPEVILCEHVEGVESPLTFEEICKRRCRVQCQRWSQFCGFTCAEDYCDSPNVQDECSSDCPITAGNREVCLTRACNSERDATCATVTCPDTRQPGNCQNLTCRNSCGLNDLGEWAGDGECDDGDLYTASSAACDWGTDCVDCGPRTGPVPAAQPHGGLCAFHTNCLGYSPTISRNRSWCLRLDGVQQGLSRCVPDCSEGTSCLPGYECVDVVDDQGNPITDAMGTVTGQACLPLMCGGT
ncbi:MAG: hypothetical protein QM778_25915 [Myxococcales bacterium]